ncbi:response regulator [Aquimarina sp. ERC-38]|uniref:response regulator n=1 Tax=Aquimarina sp. ERC-38 TaxID=2949996 RepID=UPI0022451AAF|nr:response regulator [Aquimarina sp. ERC-38]UZO82139.1 response regulator [Aquimarina sp. ERC-38]
MSQQFEHICIIDDDSIYTNLVSKIIKLNKIANHILIFRNGKEALDYLVDSIETKADTIVIPQVILLDLNMPIMDGWEFLDEFEKIKNRLSKKVSVYVVSSSINKLDIDRAKANHIVQDYLSKPLQSTDFRKILN